MISKRQYLVIGSVGALAVGVLTAAPAAAGPVVNGEYSVSSVGTNNQITTGPDGNIWLTLDGATNLAKITPTGTVTEYNAGLTGPTGIVTGPDGNLWVTVTGGVAKISPGTPTVAVVTPIAAISDPRAITVGPDGNLWTASNNNVVKIPPASPATATTYTPAGLTAARWIASGNGQLWIADFGGSQIKAITTSGASGPGYSTGGGPQGVAFGGGLAAYGNPGTSPQTIGRINPGGSPQTTNTPTSDPFGVAYGADGAFWFAQFASNNLGRLTSVGDYSTVAGLSAAAGPRQLTTGPANTLWVTLDTAEKVARVTGVESSAPDTTINLKPKKKVRTSQSKALITFGFVAGQTGATFECKLAKPGGRQGKYKPCSSPKFYRAARGMYTFSVRAVLAGETDPTPAQRSFKVIRR